MKADHRAARSPVVGMATQAAGARREGRTPGRALPSRWDGRAGRQRPPSRPGAGPRALPSWGWPRRPTAPTMMAEHRATRSPVVGTAAQATGDRRGDRVPHTFPLCLPLPPFIDSRPCCNIFLTIPVGRLSWSVPVVDSGGESIKNCGSPKLVHKIPLRPSRSYTLDDGGAGVFLRTSIPILDAPCTPARRRTRQLSNKRR